MDRVNVITDFIDIVGKYSPKWFVNSRNELIIEPKNNIYFNLTDIKNEMDLKCKIIAWLSRPSYKGISNYWQKRIGNIFNESLGANFSKNEIEQIYSFLGNDCNRRKTIEFIESNYDFNILNS
ncbi:hypothetical protein [Clostridium cadaveris]|uniref:hypothetical protein n=1 Tax=Clostridium cadaveris TaxID=1529 RepID=UPI001459EF11|nr:hypothetical protein [Clostridium cadaveris]NME65671.1 hypothetical protein [Clostridium cadaveris]